jgi:hypothetical protein
MRILLGVLLLVTGAMAQDGVAKPSKCESECCKESNDPVDYGVSLKSVNGAVLEAFQKRMGAGCTVDGCRVVVKIFPKNPVLLTDLFSALEESKTELDESKLVLRCTTVWFEEKCEALEAQFPEYAFAACQDGTTSLTFGANTAVTLADARKIGKVKQAQICACLPKHGCCGGDK